MEINVLTVVGIGLVAMFFGYFFGLFEGRGQGYRKRKKEEVGDPEAAAAVPPAPTPETQVPAPLALLEFSQNEAGRPVLHIDGKEVDALRVSAEERRRLIDLMVMLKPWIDPGGEAASKSPRSAAVTGNPGVGLTATPVRAAKSTAGFSAPRPTPAAPPPPAAALSLVAQVDMILQARLEGTPLADRGIRLAESLHGGAVVFVGSTQYDSVEQVTDMEIRDAIRGAIAEWEKKYTPG